MPLFPGQMAVDHLQTMTRASFGRAYGMSMNFGRGYGLTAKALAAASEVLGHYSGNTEIVQPTVEPPSRTALPLLVSRGFVPYLV